VRNAYSLDFGTVADVDYFELPEKRVALNLKVPESLKEHLRAVVKLWKVMAEARGSDPSDIDLTYVSVRLLKIGVDGAWSQVGAMAGLDGMPKDDEEWARLRKAILKNAETDPDSQK
jgi:hypothetical protein